MLDNVLINELSMWQETYYVYLELDRAMLAVSILFSRHANLPSNVSHLYRHERVVKIINAK